MNESISESIMTESLKRSDYETNDLFQLTIRLVLNNLFLQLNKCSVWTEMGIWTGSLPTVFRTFKSFSYFTFYVPFSIFLQHSYSIETNPKKKKYCILAPTN